MKEIWFIRHGESEANAGLPTSVAGEINLTTRGKEQASTLSSLITFPPNLFILSSYIRTHQTAEPTLQKFPDVPVEIWPIHEFDFLSPRECMNTTVDQRKPWVKGFWDKCETAYTHGDDSESFGDFQTRVLSSIKRLEEIDAGKIIVFAHGHVMRAVWQYIITHNNLVDNSSMEFFRDTMSHLPVPNTAIFKATLDGRKWRMIDPVYVPNSKKQVL